MERCIMINIKPLCIIPARGGSKRFPRKNIALLAGKPLLCHAIDVALESNLFSKICVSSEDEEILNIASNYKEIDVINRPEHLATDMSTVKDVCNDLLNKFEKEQLHFENFMVLLTTSPLRTTKDIKAAYQNFIEKNANFSLSITPFDCPPQWAVYEKDGWMQPYFGQESLKRRQELEPLYKDDGMILIAKTKAFLKEQTFYGTKTTAYYPDPEHSVDIDHPIDLIWAEFLLQQIKSKQVGYGIHQDMDI